MNKIADGIMGKDTKSTKLTDYGKERNKQIAKKRYIVEQYFGLSHLYNNAFRARFTRIAKNAIDVLFRQMAFNLFRGEKILGVTFAQLQKTSNYVIPAKAGIQYYQPLPGFRFSPE